MKSITLHGYMDEAKFCGILALFYITDLKTALLSFFVLITKIEPAQRRQTLWKFIQSDYYILCKRHKHLKNILILF